MAIPVLEGTSGRSSAAAAAGSLLPEVAPCGFRKVAIVRSRFAACWVFFTLRLAACVCLLVPIEGHLHGTFGPMSTRGAVRAKRSFSRPPSGIFARKLLSAILAA